MNKVKNPVSLLGPVLALLGLGIFMWSELKYSRTPYEAAESKEIASSVAYKPVGNATHARALGGNMYEVRTAQNSKVAERGGVAWIVEEMEVNFARGEVRVIKQRLEGWAGDKVRETDWSQSPWQSKPELVQRIAEEFRK